MFIFKQYKKYETNFQEIMSNHLIDLAFQQKLENPVRK